MEEIWKDIEGYEGLYQVSNMGRVKSVRKNIIMKPSVSKGYYVINLCIRGKATLCRVHRLVAMTFIPNPDNLPQVNHKDENHFNNNLNNLEWCDSKYNNNYGTKSERISNLLLNNKKISKTVLQYSMDGTFIREWISVREAERITGFDCGHISACCNNKRKSAYGYLWKYKKEID